jgi:hypothetical protein
MDSAEEKVFRRVSGNHELGEGDDVGAGIVTSHGYHVYVRGGGDFNRDQASWINRFNPVYMFLMVFVFIMIKARKS